MSKTKKRTLDLNTAARPTLELTLQDENKTTVLVSTPTEGLIQEVQQLSPEMLEIMKTGDQEGIDLIYDLAARLISCNRNFITMTGQELREKYNMDLESAVLFFSAYMDFLSDLTNEKN